MGGQELTSCPGCRCRCAIVIHRHCNLLHPDGSGLLILTLLSLRRGLLARPAVRLAVPVPPHILGERLVGHVVLSALDAGCEGSFAGRNVEFGWRHSVVEEGVIRCGEVSIEMPISAKWQSKERSEGAGVEGCWLVDRSICFDG